MIKKIKNWFLKTFWQPSTVFTVTSRKLTKEEQEKMNQIFKEMHATMKKIHEVLR